MDSKKQKQKAGTWSYMCLYHLPKDLQGRMWDLEDTVFICYLSLAGSSMPSS